jgi:hypothetical protein
MAFIRKRTLPSGKIRWQVVWDTVEPKTDSGPICGRPVSAMRLIVDRAVLEFALSHTFTPGDFTINQWGGCRLHPQMAKVVTSQVLERPG